MAEKNQQKRAKIHLKQFLADYKAGVPDREIMHSFGLSARSLVSLIKTLIDKKVLTAGDLTRRKHMTEEQEQVKETQFLKSLFICPNCGHPHPQKFDLCPACGASPDDYTNEPGAAGAGQESEEAGSVDDVTTDGGYFYVEDVTTAVAQGPVTDVVEKEETVSSPPPENQSPPPPRVAAAPKKAPTTPSEKAPDEDKEKASPFKSVRALFSKIRRTE
jgi:hypothetical protein